MLDLTKIDLPIKHRSDGVPGLAYTEVYELGDMVYTEWYDGLSKEFLHGKLEIYGVNFCLISPEGDLSFEMPPLPIFNHKDMMSAIDDLKRIDEFLSVISVKYSKQTIL